MNRARWLASLILVFAAVACGSASGTAITATGTAAAPSGTVATASGPAATASHRPALAEPGQPVPASAVQRLTAIADWAVRWNGAHPVAWATAVVTTHAKALTSATPGDTTLRAKAVVYLVTIKGYFVCVSCSVPLGDPAPTGTYLSLVINARTFTETDFGIGPTPPPVPPARFGPVTYLKVHQLAPN